MVLHSSPEGRFPVVSACSRSAVQRGVRLGMPLAESGTLVPRGWFAVHDSEADTAGLRRLAWQCQRFTPHAGLEPADAPECLWLNVMGCVHLFGNLTSLLAAVTKHFHQQGYRIRLSVAPTFGAAWGFSRYGKWERSSVETTGLVRELSPLPLAALRLSRETLELLTECGLQTVGQLLILPRSSLPGRFGPEVLLRLDQALGEATELLESEMPPQPIRADSRFEYPLVEMAAIFHVLERLLASIIATLKLHQRETQHVLMTWCSDQGESGTIDIRLLRPTGSAERLWELLNLKLDGLQLPGAIKELGLEAIPCRPQGVRRTTLFDQDDSHETEFLNLVERLSSRLGEQAVVRCRQIPEFQPEMNCVLEPWLADVEEQGRGSREPTGMASLVRPCRLVQPVPVKATVDASSGRLQTFQWQRREYVVSLCDGPERIVTGWWRSPMIRRDYYRVETTSGVRFWLFRHLDHNQWFLQGLYD